MLMGYSLKRGAELWGNQTIINKLW